MLTPLFRAVEQIDDPVFLGVLLRSLALSVLAFLALLGGSAWAVQHVVGQPGWLGWAAGIAGGLGAALLAVWLFVPVALLIATLFIDRVAGAVDRRHYPWLPPPVGGAPLSVQAWDGVILGVQLLAWQLVALGLALALPGVGLLIGWAITGWAIGRGLFVGVAMRRMQRPQALLAYSAQRWPVLLLGGVFGLAGSVPLLNLLVPVLGVAALTHVLNRGLSQSGQGPDRAVFGRAA